MNRFGRHRRSSSTLETRSTLLRGVRDPRNAGSWGEFHDLYGPLIRSHARRWGLAEHDAEDVVQEVFRKLITSLRTFRLDPPRPRGRFRAWLKTVTRNAILDRPRREPPMGDLPDPAEPPSDDQWLRDYRRRILEIVLRRVQSEAKPRDWYAFEQHLLLKRRAAAVAQELGITVNNVFKITSRVFARVRDLCLKYDEDLFDDEDGLPG